MANSVSWLPAPTNKEAFEMLCIRAGEDGRDRDLFGGSFRALFETE